MFSFTRLVAYSWVYLGSYIIIAIIVTKVISALYLRTDYDKWWSALLPFGHYYYKRQLAGIELYFIIPSILAHLTFITSYSIVPFLIWLVFSCICDYKFAILYLDNYNAFVYALVPFAKYVIMLKEVITRERNDSRRRI